MRRILVVAGDRALTKFVAEALLGRSLTAGAPRPQDPWDIARAHSALESFMLVTKGGRPFDVIVIDQGLPDQDPLQLVDKFRKAEISQDVPIFLISERGRDQHSRRMASERYNVAGFIEKPVTADSIRAALGNLERKRRILLVESSEPLAERYRNALGNAGYLTEVASRGRDGLDRAPRFRPDVVISSLHLEDMRGADVCVELKRSRTQTNIPVVLYGQVSELASQEISENAHRADDFVQAPFDDEILVERIASLIGRGVAEAGRRAKSLRGVPVPVPIAVGLAPIAPLSPSITTPDEGRVAAVQKVIDSDTAIHAGSAKSTREYINRDIIEDPPPAPPPPSASPAAVGPTKRSTRRVPCQLSMSIRNGEQVYTSKTLDISHGGIFLAIDEALAIGTLIDMTFQIPNSSRVVNAVGKVAWVGRAPDGGNGTAGVGVKFSKIDPADLQLIVDYVNRVSRVVYSPS